MRLVVALLLACLAFPAHASRGFGSTYGTGATDTVQTTLASTPTGKVSYSIWFYRNGNGGGSLGRLWNTPYDDVFCNGGSFAFQRTFSTTTGQWYVLFPSSQFAWHHFVITYDGSSTSNVPKFYEDGVAVSINSTTSPVGTLSTGTNPYVIGNVAAGTRNWDGKIAEFARWDGVILTADQVLALYHGVSPLEIDAAALAFYAPLLGNTTGEKDWSPNNAGAFTVTGTKGQPHVRTALPLN